LFETSSLIGSPTVSTWVGGRDSCNHSSRPDWLLPLWLSGLKRCGYSHLRFSVL